MPKSERFELRITQAERAALEEFSKLSNQSMSETIRSLLRAALFVIAKSSDAELEAAAGNMA